MVEGEGGVSDLVRTAVYNYYTPTPCSWGAVDTLPSRVRSTLPLTSNCDQWYDEVIINNNVVISNGDDAMNSNV